MYFVFFLLTHTLTNTNKTAKMLPKTSAASMTDYEEFFEKELAGYDELIHFSISNKSSVSHTVAKQAAESFNGKVRVIDSMNLSSGQGLVVLKAADLLTMKMV